MDYRKAIDEAMSYCITLPYFRCGLFICTEGEYNYVCAMIEYDSNFTIEPAYIGTGAILTFDNGSVMHIICLPEVGFCAQRLHMVYVTEYIEQEVIDTVIRPMVIPYQFRDVIKIIGAKNKRKMNTNKL